MPYSNSELVNGIQTLFEERVSAIQTTIMFSVLWAAIAFLIWFMMSVVYDDRGHLVVVWFWAFTQAIIALCGFLRVAHVDRIAEEMVENSEIFKSLREHANG
jgi:Zn-dependent protease